MNPLPDSVFWLRTLGVPALQVTALLALAGLLTAKLPAARNRRVGWLAAFAAAGLLVAASFLGADRQVAAWLAAKPAPERVFRVRTNLPVDGANLESLPANGGESTLRGVAPEPNAAPPTVTAKAVWWPAWLWLAGSAVLLGRKLIWRGVFAFWWRGRQAEASPELFAHVAEVARRLGFNRRVRVIASPALVCPIAFGVLRPTVGLPGNFATAHGAREREAMLAHELAHLAARDPFWLGLADLLAAVLWWHPLVWWARRQLRAACETAADEASVLVEDGPAVLANCLVTLAARLPRRRAFGLLGMAGFRSDLGRRVERLLALRGHGLRPTARGRLVLAAMGGTAVAVALTLASTAWALPRTLREQPTLFAMTQQALAAAQPATPDPTSVLASTPTPPLSDPTSTSSRTDANDAPWQASLLIELAIATDSNRKAQMAACMDALVRRLYATREFSSVKCEPAEPDRIRVSLGLKDTNALSTVKTLVEQRGRLEFRVVHPDSDSLLFSNACPVGYEILPLTRASDISPQQFIVARQSVGGLGNSNIASAEVIRDPIASRTRVGIMFDETGRTRFAELTRTNIDRQIAVLLDGKLLMAPSVREPITGGKCEITGSDFAQTATVLAASLQVPLPAQLKLLEMSIDGPTAANTSSEAENTAEPVKTVSIQVKGDGRVLIDGRELKLEAVRGEVEKAKARAPDLVLRLVADADAPMTRLVEVLDKCREAGVTRISLNTLGTAKPATNAPPTSSSGPPAQSAEPDRSARAAALVRDARLLYELGKLDEAKAKLESALKLEPDNDAARYYLKRVGEAEAAKTRNGGTKPGTPHLPPSSGKANRFEGIKFDPGAEQGAMAKILAKPVSLHLENTTLQDILSEVGRAEGINFASDQPLSVFQQRLSINLEQVPLLELLRYISRNLDVQFQVGDKLVWVVDGKAPTSAASASGGSETDDNQLFTRTLKVNPERLRQSLTAIAGNMPTNQPPGQLLRSLFAAAGVDFGGPNVFAGGTNGNVFQNRAGKAVFYNEHTGLLLIRATMGDLRTVETVVDLLTVPPPQVTIEAKFVEITGDDSKALGFDWYLGNTLMTTNGPVATNMPGMTGSVATITGLIKTDPQFRSVVEALQRGGTNGVRDLRGDELDWPGRPATNAHNVRVTAALGTSMTGVLTDPQYRVVLRALEQRSGADVLSAPRVTTVSGRQAQIQVADMRTVVNGIDPAALIQLGAQPRTNAVPFLTSTIPVGPTLDVVPTVAADGYTIRLNVIASVAEFLGYDQPPADAKVTVWQGGKASEVAVPLPRFRVRQMTTQALLWDGQTLVLAGMPVEDSVTMKDKVPVLGDLPVAGSLFRSESKSTVKKNLLVFITATIIDPAGNRVHSADNLPYDPTRVPSQTAR